MDEKKHLEGLGGWLILVGLGVVGVPWKIIFFEWPYIKQIFSEGIFSILMTPGTENYHPALGGLIILMTAKLLILVIVWFYINLLFFTKKSSFPKWYIGTLLVGFCFSAIMIMATNWMLSNPFLFSDAEAHEVLLTLFWMAVWIPYVLFSRRVKATFIY